MHAAMRAMHGRVMDHKINSEEDRLRLIEQIECV